jgi:tetratricopeptide (TPR) repeat protein
VKAALLLLLPVVITLPPMAGTAQQPATQPQAVANNYSLLMTTGADELVAGKFSRAATSFQKAAALDPQNPQAQFWAGQALVYADRPEQAIYFLERAQSLGSDSVSLHLALVAAYAGALRPKERDQERALLSAWHRSADHPTLARSNGFLLETIFVRPWHVNVMEYFQPPAPEPNPADLDTADQAKADPAKADPAKADPGKPDPGKPDPGNPDLGKPDQPAISEKPTRRSRDMRNAIWRFTVRDSVDLIELTYLLTTADGAPESSDGRAKHGYVLLHFAGEAMQMETPGATGVSENRADNAPAPVGQPVKAYPTRPPYDVVRADVLQRVRSIPMLSKR